MGAQGFVIMVFGMLLCAGGLAYLAGLLHDADERRGASLVAVPVVGVCAIALGVANPQVWPLFALCFPSTACVVVEALRHV